MPWLLTTPVNTGDTHPTNCAEVRITDMRHRSGSREMIIVSLEYGDTLDGVWVPGPSPAGVATSVVLDKSGAYAAITQGSVPNVLTVDPDSAYYAKVGDVWVERTYIATKRGLYEWLAAGSHIGPGTIS